RVVSSAGGLLCPRSESYRRQAAFFVRAANRIVGRRPSLSAQRIVSSAGGFLCPRSESHPRREDRHQTCEKEGMPFSDIPSFDQ
ncbi:hypothetical protein, partial [Phocaeicola abscessus]|uniref:hypothetical protein n=1 Tax=Phocaeicola abscessus TaxID=555313 RepID=UPI001C550BDC